jgi:hypothetical protein
MKKTHVIAVPLLAGALALGGCAHMERSDAPKADVYNISQGKPVPITAKKTDFPLVIYGEGPGKMGTYVPSGYMGDTAALKLLSANLSAPLEGGKEGKSALKISYTAKGPGGWAGVYWLSPANNWAKIKGAGYDLTGSPKLTFWARGERGGERISEIKIGGILGPYPDTDSASVQGIKLTDEWKQYEVDLSGKDMRHIVGGFMFALRRPDSPRGATFYLDEIRFEAPPAAGPEVSQSDSDQGTAAASAVPGEENQ